MTAAVIDGKTFAASVRAQEAARVLCLRHGRTRGLPGICRQADIPIAAGGRPSMIKGDWIKPGATMIDVDINCVQHAQSTDRRTE